MIQMLLVTPLPDSEILVMPKPKEKAWTQRKRHNHKAVCINMNSKQSKKRKWKQKWSKKKARVDKGKQREMILRVPLNLCTYQMKQQLVLAVGFLQQRWMILHDGWYDLMLTFCI